MFSRIATSREALRLLFLILLVSTPNLLSGQVVPRWTTKPSYETPSSHSTAFVVKDTRGIQHTLYSESHAVLIIEGNYQESSWDNVSEPGTKNQDLLVKRLESRGFQVVVWRDLTGSQLDTTLKEVRSNFGYVVNSRLFLYFYGHGYSVNSSDSEDARTFLVPVDAPNPVKNEAEFYRVALPISLLLEISKEITVKHSFFALEACKSGAVTSALDFFDFPRPLGYLLSREILNSDHVILTAASRNQDILANSPFTPLLAAALEQGDSNHDGYVTGSEVVSFVKEHLPQAVSAQTPQVMWFPLTDGGDFIFGPAIPDSIATIAMPPIPLVITPKPKNTRTPARPAAEVPETGTPPIGISGTWSGEYTLMPNKGSRPVYIIFDLSQNGATVEGEMKLSTELAKSETQAIRGTLQENGSLDLTALPTPGDPITMHFQGKLTKGASSISGKVVAADARTQGKKELSFPGIFSITRSSQ